MMRRLPLGWSLPVGVVCSSSTPLLCYHGPENGRYKRYGPRDMTTTAKPKRSGDAQSKSPLHTPIPDTPENIVRAVATTLRSGTRTGST